MLKTEVNYHLMIIDSQFTCFNGRNEHEGFFLPFISLSFTSSIKPLYSSGWLCTQISKRPRNIRNGVYPLWVFHNIPISRNSCTENLEHFLEESLHKTDQCLNNDLVHHPKDIIFPSLVDPRTIYNLLTLFCDSEWLVKGLTLLSWKVCSFL